MIDYEYNQSLLDMDTHARAFVRLTASFMSWGMLKIYHLGWAGWSRAKATRTQEFDGDDISTEHQKEPSNRLSRVGFKKSSFDIH